MIKEYISKLGKQNEVIATVYLDDINKGKLHKDLICVSLNGLYPNIILQLYDNFVIDINKESAYKIRWFLKNKSTLKSVSTNEYGEWKIFINSFFGKKLNKQEQIFVTEYINLFYEDLIKEFQDDIIYIDCDMLFIKPKPIILEWIKKLDIPFDYIESPYFWIESKKRLIYALNNGEIESKGFSYKRESLLERKKVIEDIIKSEMRNDKLNEIGI